MNDYQYTQNDDIQIRVDSVRPETSVDYRFTGTDEWLPSPFQSSEVSHLTIYDVLKMVDEYLESQN